MKKYNFDLILTDEQLKANRLRTIQDEKDKRDTKIALLIASMMIILIITLLASNKNYKKEDLSKCENGTITIMTARQYDNQLETFCK